MIRLTVFFTSILSLASILLTGCGAPKAEAVVKSDNISAVASLDSELIYGNTSGELHSSSSMLYKGKGAILAIATIEKRVFISTINDLKLTIQELPDRVVYESSFDVTHTSRLLVSKENRLVANANLENGVGELISLDPDLSETQQPNILYTGRRIASAAISAGGVLWLVEQRNDGSEIRRVLGNDVAYSTKSTISSIASYSDTELVACMPKTGTLQRFSITNGTQILSGRKLAKDCISDATLIDNKKFVYVSRTGINEIE